MYPFEAFHSLHLLYIYLHGISKWTKGLSNNSSARVLVIWAEEMIPIYILIGKPLSVCLSVCPKLILGDGTSYDHEIWRVYREWWRDGACKVIGHTEVKFKSCGQTLKWLWIAWISGSIILTIYGTFSQNLIPKKCNFITFLTQNKRKK